VVDEVFMVLMIVMVVAFFSFCTYFNQELFSHLTSSLAILKSLISFTLRAGGFWK